MLGATTDLHPTLTRGGKNKIVPILDSETWMELPVSGTPSIVLLPVSTKLLIGRRVWQVGKTITNTTSQNQKFEFLEGRFLKNVNQTFRKIRNLFHPLFTMFSHKVKKHKIMCHSIMSHFYRTQVSLGSDLWVRLSLCMYVCMYETLLQT